MKILGNDKGGVSIITDKEDLQKLIEQLPAKNLEKVVDFIG